MKRKFVSLSAAAAVAVCAVGSGRVRGADVFWSSNGGFQPATVVISPGESVTWWNNDDFFPVQVTSDAPFGNPNYFSFLLVDYGDSATRTFPNQGTFGYHSNYGQQGYVVVNIPPVVTITNPPNGAVFTAPATVLIQVEASETPDDVVWDVAFFVANGSVTNLISVDDTAPFSAVVTNLPPGSYTLIAVATDYYYATATNAVSITVVGGGPIQLSAPRRVGNQFLFDATGLTPGRTNVLQVSTNLVSWTGLQTNVATAASATFTNALLPGARFYRLVQRP
ncbi:MAG: Ig-like domain-containing protein [Verrucomicrobiales bacterium]|nr:Ig-like domain-containing protein [Verrucomicrobiales bacterium]